MMLSLFFVRLKLNVWSTCGQFINNKWFHWARYLVNMCVILTNMDKEQPSEAWNFQARLVSLHLKESFEGEKITHQNGGMVGNDGFLFRQVQAYLKWCSCPKLIFLLRSFSDGTLAKSPILNPKTQQIIQIQWFLWYHLGSTLPSVFLQFNCLSIHPSANPTPRWYCWKTMMVICGTYYTPENWQFENHPCLKRKII